MRTDIVNIADVHDRCKSDAEQDADSSCTSGLRCSVADPYGNGRCRRMKRHLGYHTHGGLAWAPNAGLTGRAGGEHGTTGEA